MRSTHADPVGGFAEATALARVAGWHTSRSVTPAPGQGPSSPYDTRSTGLDAGKPWPLIPLPVGLLCPTHHVG